MPQVVGQQPLIRIECPDGNVMHTRVFIGDIEVSRYVCYARLTFDLSEPVVRAEVSFVYPVVDAAGVATVSETDDPTVMLDYLHNTDQAGGV